MSNRAMRRFTAGLVVSAVAFSLAVWLSQRRIGSQRDQYDSAKRLDDVIAYVSSVYVDSVSPPDLYQFAIDGMLRKLGDPYTDYLANEDLEALSLSATGNYVGIGVRIESSDGLITVVTPIAGTPAEEAGILPGDRIVQINDLNVTGWTTDDAAAVLRGEEGEPVDLVIARPGTRVPLRFRLVRASIHVSSVRHAELLSEHIGYVWLETVSENSAEELRDTITELRENGAEELILDLRSNPGGLLNEAIAIADLFLQPGDVIVETRGRDRRLTRKYEARAPEQWPDMPLLVLVNEFSASASEIIAGAVQDHDRGVLIGTPTFGKGLVQTIFPFGRERALKITTGRWFTPLGRSIQRNGDGAPVTMHDSVLVELDTVRTESGRAIPASGGIQPDILASSDSVPTGEEIFISALGGNVQEFRDALSSFALSVRADSTLTTEDFAMTPALREELRRHMADQGITVSDDVWNQAVDYIDREASYRLLRYVFGSEAEMRRRTANDHVVAAGVALLNEVETTGELLNAAARR